MNVLTKTSGGIIHAENHSKSEYVSPALAYLAMIYEASRYVIRYRLSVCIWNLGKHDDITTFPCHQLRSHHVQTLLQALALEQCKLTTINSYLSAVKGVMRENWSLKKVSSEDWTAIKEIKWFKGSRLIAGSALNKDEVYKFFDQKDHLKGVRHKK